MVFCIRFFCILYLIVDLFALFILYLIFDSFHSVQHARRQMGRRILIFFFIAWLFLLGDYSSLSAFFLAFSYVMAAWLATIFILGHFQLSLWKFGSAGFAISIAIFYIGTMFCVFFWFSVDLDVIERSGRLIAFIPPIFVKNAWCGAKL